MAREVPQHLVLGQEHRLEAARCDDESGKLERDCWRCGFTAAKRNAVRVKSESSLATSAGTFVAAPKLWGLEWVWPTRGWQTKAMSVQQGRITMAWAPILSGLTVFSVYFHHSEGWTERNQQLLEMLGDEVRRCARLWVIGGDFNMEPEAFEQFATPARLPGILVAPTIPTFRHGASVRRFDYFVVHRAGGIWHQPAPPSLYAAEALFPRPGHEGASGPSSPSTACRGLCGPAVALGDPARKEHGREMGVAYALHRV